MRSLLRTVLAGAALVAVSNASPAWATANTFVFDTNYYGTNNSMLLAAGATKDFYATVSNTTIKATVSAWNANKASGATNYTLSTAQLGEWAGGLGVLSSYDDYNGCGAGNCGMHQIDGVGNTTGSKSYDFVQIVFDKAVTLSAVSRVAYAQEMNGKNVYDDDFSYGNGTSAAVMKSNTALAGNVLTSKTVNNAIVPTNSALSTATFNGMLDSDYYKAGSCSLYANTGVCFDQNSSTMNGVTADQWHASTVWWISASLLNPDNVSDAFKIYDLSVIYNDAPVSIASVPEPASWAMMIGGFGLIGGALRRKKAQERLAAA